MRGYNKVIIMGNLGKDPETRIAASGKAVAKFPVAVNGRKGGEDTVEWFNCVCFDKTAELAQEYLKKGSGALVEGELQTSKYEKDGEEKRYTELVARNITFVGAKADEAKAPF